MEQAPPIRVLIVDDSAFMRYSLSQRLSETAGLTVVGTAHDGRQALALIPEVQPDVITLDVEMPNMDGLTTLREIMASAPRPVIMLSSLTTEGARETIQALTWGAVDFVAKPSSKANIEPILAELVAKIRRAAGARVFAAPAPRRDEDRAEPGRAKAPAYRQPLDRAAGDRAAYAEKVIVIGTSTGGPRALNAIIPQLPPDLPAALLIVQHMPAGFTRSLAERLDSVSQIAVKEASAGDRLESGRVLIAPGGFHMVLNPNRQIEVNQSPAVHGVRPAVDVTMASVAKVAGEAAVGVVLTGMGSDGTNGSALIHSAGGYVIAEAESTSVVWGMPRCVIEAGLVDEVVPLQEVALAIERIVKRNA